MNSYKLKIIAGVLMLLLAGWLGRMFLFPPDENQKIEKVIKFAAAVFEEKKSAGLGEFLTADFKVDGHASREEVLDYLKMFFFKTRDLSVSIKHLRHENEKLPATAVKARVLLVVVVTGTVDGEKFQAFSGQGADTVMLTMRKEQERWLVASARAINTGDMEKAFEQISK